MGLKRINIDNSIPGDYNHRPEAYRKEQACLALLLKRQVRCLGTNAWSIPGTSLLLDVCCLSVLVMQKVRVC